MKSSLEQTTHEHLASSTMNNLLSAREKTSKPTERSLGPDSLAAVAVIAIATLVLIGWQLDLPLLKSVFPRLVAMNPATAAAFFLSGIALLALRPAAGPRLRAAGMAAALAVCGIGGAKLAGVLLGVDMRIDRILFPDKLAAIAGVPSRMAPNTAAAFLLSGAACFLLLKARRFVLAHLLTLSVTLVALLALVGYSYGFQALYGVPSYIPMALPTAFAFFLLSMGLLAARPREGIVREITSAGPGGASARRLLPAAVLVPAVLGWLRLAGQRRGLYPVEFGVSLIVVSSAFFFAFLIWWNARVLNRAERARERAVQERLKSELLLQGILDNTPSVVSVKDLDGRYLFINKRFEELFGITRETAIGKTSFDVFPPDMAAAFRANDAKVLEAQAALHVEESAPHEDGLHAYISVKFPLRDEAGGVTALCSISTDITERKRADEQIQRFFGLSLEMLCIAGFDGYFKRLNPVWERVLGFPETELLSRPFIEFVHPEDRDRTIAEAGRLATSSYETVSFTNRYRCADGSYKTLLWNARSDPEGQSIFAAARDVTEQKRIQEELEASEERLQLALESARMGAWDLDLVHDTSIRSLRHDQIFGYQSLQSLWGSEIFLNHVLPEDRELAQERFRQAFASGQLDMECRVLWPDQSVHWIAAQGRVYRDEKGDPVRMMGLVIDVSERKRAEEEIGELNRELGRRVEDLNLLNSELEAFSYSVSHDLRAPLRHIAGYAQLLEKSSKALDEKGQRYLTTIVEAAHRMGRLIDDLLLFSRMGRAEMRRTRVDLRKLFEEVRRDFEAEAGGREVAWEVDGLPEIEGDPALLRQVLVNLISNALKYTATRAPARIQVGSFREDGEAVVFVRDNGVGFDMSYAGKLFGVFQRLHRAEEFEGTGIGLANVRRIVHRHGGRTWAEGAVGEGATFYFSLPAQGRKEAP